MESYAKLNGGIFILYLQPFLSRHTEDETLSAAWPNVEGKHKGVETPSQSKKKKKRKKNQEATL